MSARILEIRYLFNVVGENLVAVSYCLSNVEMHVCGDEALALTLWHALEANDSQFFPHRFFFRLSDPEVRRD